MTEQSLKAALDETVEHSAVAAEALLKADGWEIIRQLYIVNVKSIGATSVVMIPVLENYNAILEKLSDPTAFDAVVKTLQKDIAQVVDNLGVLIKLHENKSGEPTIEELPLVDKLSTGYVQIQNDIDTIRGLLLTVVEVLQEAGIDTLKLANGESINE